MLDETNIEEFVNLVIAYVQLFKLFESLDTLHLFEFAAANVKNSHIFERCTDISEGRNNRII